jgi:hypothetical protein
MIGFTGLNNNTKYYVRAKTDVSGYGTTTSFTTAPLKLASIVSPANNTLNINVSLNIYSNNIPGASTYTIQLSETSNFNVIAFTQSSASRIIAFYGLKYGTKYYARVKTDLSGFGVTSSFTTGLPELFTCMASPANNSVNNNVNLNIYSVIISGATSYTIQLSKTKDFSLFALNYTGQSRMAVVTGLNYNTKYYSRVKTNLTGNFGRTDSFTTVLPEYFTYVVSPANNSANNNVNLNIYSNIVPGATSYTILLSDTRDFSSNTVLKTSSSVMVTFNGLKYSTKYFTQVETNLSGNFGKTDSFTTAPPEYLAYVISPLSNSVNNNVSLNISSNIVPGASSYTIQLSEFNDFSVIAFNKTSASRMIAFSGLKHGTKYYTRVQTGLSSNFGKTISFTTSITTSKSAYEVTGINQAEASNALNVYPNPTSGLLNIALAEANGDNLVEVYDISGKILYHQMVSLQNQQQLNLDLSSYRPATYFIVVRNNKQIFKTKVVKE